MLRLFTIFPRVLFLLTMMSPLCARAESPLRVVTTIKPLHALVGGIMSGVGEPVLLIDGSTSPHSYRLTPADARQLETADLVVRMGDFLESRLAKPMQTLVPPDKLLTLNTRPALTRLPARHGGAWADDDGHGDHGHGRYDPHTWLDPDNAAAMVNIIARRLQQLDPGHAEQYATNAERVAKRIAALDRRIAAELADVQNAPYLVFHDALHYFEHHYGLNPAGALTIDPERRPGARRLVELRRLIEEKHIRCVFHEPQFGTALADVLLENTGATLVTVDPLGLNIPPGFEGYLQLMQQLADNMHGCLANEE
jgi:zinc transport system substrate-binding protein